MSKRGWVRVSGTSRLECLRIAHRAAARAGVSDPAVLIEGRTIAGQMSARWTEEVSA